MQHPFWGRVEESWAGLVAEHDVVLPGFEQPVEVFLGEELDDEDEEYAPTPAQLDAYAATLQAFMGRASEQLADLKEQSFARYQRVYARWYENPAQSGEPALGLTTAAAHAGYLSGIKYLRVTDEQTLRLVLSYELDPEHGLEAKFVANVLVTIGGIADT
ncbi:hypothetical protein [Hymenobacter actinosclerus]|uniref:Uncharacterized protein n=1 Tax=Hymenobacter actinosclerus TaxID=82805 RepID=A0A1I0DX80_9BACT|nr:hypothetical protein [Hymenobacter actinosclerus]SET37140.1 hypothetical protein SAMN04487998_1600 [Hymenobacter actinosclerus]